MIDCNPWLCKIHIQECKAVLKRKKEKIVSGKQTTKTETNLSMPSDMERLLNKIRPPLWKGKHSTCSIWKENISILMKNTENKAKKLIPQMPHLE